MTNKEEIFKDKSLLIVFTYAPAGFGHLRVMDALYDGLSDKTNARILDTHDQRLTYFHRLSSVHPLVRRVFEWMQQGFPEEIFARVYRSYLHARTKSLYEQIETVISQHKERPKTLLVIATHFGLGHQFGKIKEQIEKEFGLKMILIVQVTDDSPQKLWFVPEADVIFVPSSYTQQRLLEYGNRRRLKLPKIEINTYPISPLLTEKLNQERYQDRIDQVKPETTSPIQVIIPVSGAAVGLDFFIKLCTQLHEKNSRFKFHILVKKTLYTEMFVSKMIELPYINLHISPQDRQMVNHYEEIYKEENIAIEITKPSEQSFKALLSPYQVGGSILLFTRPIGRQEYDNLNYLRRGNFIPSKEQNHQILHAAKENQKLDLDPSGWRGMQLSDNPRKAADLIDWLIRKNFLYSMTTATEQDSWDSSGVDKFWEKVREFMNSKT